MKYLLFAFKSVRLIKFDVFFFFVSIRSAIPTYFPLVNEAFQDI